MRQSKPHLHGGYYRCRIDGQEKHLGKDKRLAMQRFRRLMLERVVDTNADGPPRTVNGAIVAWRKIHDRPCYTYWLAPFAEFAGGRFLNDVGQDLLTRYLLHLKDRQARRWSYDAKARTWSPRDTGRGLSDETIRHYIRAASSVLKWCHRQKWSSDLPDTPKMPCPVRHVRDLAPGELLAALESMKSRSGRAERILRFIAVTGCRPGEACGLEWEHVHLERGVCLLSAHKTARKTGKPRTLYLTPEAREVLADLQADANRRMNGKPTGPVFTSGDGVPYKPSGLRSILKRWAGATPYQLRHTFAQTASERGTPVDVLAKLLGHRTTHTTAFYYDVRDERAIAAAAGLGLAPPVAQKGKRGRKGESA